MKNIAFIGSAICGRKSQCQIDTFVNIIEAHLNIRATRVGTPGGLDERNIMKQVLGLPRDVDLVVIFHSREHSDRDNVEYTLFQERMDNHLKENNIPVIHCVYKSYPAYSFSWGSVDNEIMLYPETTRTHRVSVGYDVSDNGIDYAGNQMAARRLLDHMTTLGLI